jgi:flagellar motor component MotA
LKNNFNEAGHQQKKEAMSSMGAVILSFGIMGAVIGF